MSNRIKIISKKEIIKPSGKLTEIYKETEELIAIIGKSIKTAQKNKGIRATICILNILRNISYYLKCGLEKIVRQTGFEPVALSLEG